MRINVKFVQKIKIMGQLSNAQMELLEFFKQDLVPNELLELRRLLVAFKAQRVFAMLDEQWEKEKWTDTTMQNWAMEHNRTPYISQNDYLTKMQK